MKRRLKTVISKVLAQEDTIHIHNSYDVLGDIAVLRLTESSRRHAQIIAEAIMSTRKNVRTVMAQTGPVHGDFRLRKLEHIAGENKIVTVHKEAGCLFAVDVAKCYFSPRLLYERRRIARDVEDGETIVNMFAGVGCFSIIIAQHSDAERVYSIDINPKAVQFMKENVRLNRVYEKVIPLLGDAKEIIEKRLLHVADRVLMPLPEKALEYLPCALLALKESGGWIHYYDFEHALKNEDPIGKVKQKVIRELQSLKATFKVPFGRVVRATGPNWYQIVLDIKTKSKQG